MIWLLVRNGRKQYQLFNPDTYGCETWGTSYQDSIIKKKKTWYTTYWHDNGEWLDDTYIESRLNVVLETTDIGEILRYIYDHNKSLLGEILDSAQEIFNTYIEFHKWAAKLSDQ